MFPPSVGLDDLAMRDGLAQESYQVKTFMIKGKVLRKPTLDTLYYNQAEAIVETVPSNFPLSLLLEKYNDVSHQASHLVHDTNYHTCRQLQLRSLPG